MIPGPVTFDAGKVLIWAIRILYGEIDVKSRYAKLRSHVEPAIAQHLSYCNLEITIWGPVGLFCNIQQASARELKVVVQIMGRRNLT